MSLWPVGPIGLRALLSLCRRGTLLRRLKDFSAAHEDLARARELGALEAQEARRQLVLTYDDCAVHCYTLG